ncbi:hypothetical protein BCR42DRAFT_446132 [Absidia repens]|uniref:Uncharacterized protein n=1 Tax=Absidia repens TaxID=90262 RepID=A0A1X2IZN1_9FUNG|nr:hypothetical protein BCR42DRAFT_446132 [Absidia repens]
MNGDAKPKAPAAPKMEASSTTATRRPSTLQSSNTSSTTRTKLKPSLSSAARGTASSTTRSTTTPKSPVSPSPTVTSSIRRGLKTGDTASTPRSPTTLTPSASRRASTISPSLRSAGPAPTPSSTLSRRATTTSPKTTATGLTKSATPTSTLSRRATTTSTRTPADLTSNPSTSVQRKSTLTRSNPSTTTNTSTKSPNTPTPTLSRRVSINSSSTTSSRGSTPSSTTSTRSSLSTKPSTTSTITEEDEENGVVSTLETEVKELTEQIKQMEQDIEDNKAALTSKQNDIDIMHQQLDESQSQQEEQLLESILDMTEQLKEKETQRDEALATLEQWSAQAEERLVLTRQLEEMEESYRSEMESLRDELQSANDQLESTLKALDRELDASEETSGTLREEIQGMHKSHQTRMTGISNQLNQEHNEETTNLVQSFDKELEEKQNSSEWAAVDTKRKEMIDLERTIQTLEEKLATMEDQFIKNQQTGKTDDEDKLNIIMASHEEERLKSSDGLDNQISQMELEHAEQIESLKARQQSELALASASGTTGINEAIEKIELDIKAELEADHQQKLEVVHQDHQTPSKQAQSQLDDAVNNLTLLKTTIAQEHDVTRKRLDQQYIDEKALAIAQFETDFTEKLDAVIKSYETTLDKYRISSEQENNSKVETLEIEHSQELKTLTDNHNAKILELQSSTAAATRASTERQIRADYEMKIEALAGHHRQALEDLQSDHRLAIKNLEEALENIKENTHPTNEASSTSPAENQDCEDKSANKNPENDSIDIIRAQVQASLNEIHSAATAKMVTEHESRLSEMKRDHILQKDRAIEHMTKDFEARLAEIKQENTDIHKSTQQAHDNEINSTLTAAKNDLTEQQQTMNNQHKTKTQKMEADHQQRIQVLTDEIAQHTKQRDELESMKRQLQEEMTAFNISSTKEIQDSNALMDENEIKIYQDLEMSHNTTLNTMKTDHQTAIDTLLAEHQLKLQHAETQEDHKATNQSSPEMEDTLGDSYKAQIEQYVLEQEAKVTDLQEAVNILKQQNATLKADHQTHLKTSENDWTMRLEDVTKSTEQLSATTLLNEPIRTRMNAEAKEAQDKLIAAHTSSLESQNINHTQTVEQLSEKQDTEIDELNARLQPLVEEQEGHADRLKELEKEHQEQLKNLTDAHTESVDTFNSQWVTKESEHIKNLKSHQTQLEEIQQQLHGLEADYQLKTARQEELQIQLDKQSTILPSDQPSITDHDESYQPLPPSSSTLERDILEKQNALQAKETELQQLEEQWRKLVEEKKATQNTNNKKNKEMVYGLVIKHQEGIDKMHRHFQHLLDVKDEEVNNVSYRLKTVTSARQKDIDKRQDKQHGKISSLEQQRQHLMDSYTAKANSYSIIETTSHALKDKIARSEVQLDQMTKENQDTKAKVDTYKEENNKLLLNIHQLQSKMHKIQLG